MMIFKCIFLYFLVFYNCYGADIAVFYTKHDVNNSLLKFMKENYVTNFQLINERYSYCPNFEDIKIVNHNNCTLPVIFYPITNKSIDEKSNCLFKEYINQGFNEEYTLNNYMEIQRDNNTWVIQATKDKTKHHIEIILESSMNFYKNIYDALKKVMDFVEEEHYHECRTKKKMKDFEFLKQIGSDFIVISKNYWITIMLLLMLSLMIGIYLLISYTIMAKKNLKNYVVTESQI
uniref:Unspecified product n=1 Tax=Parastrongyloides trichosuri TaxID=131310 RepID=A0A0N4ZV15_PARTI